MEQYKSIVIEKLSILVNASSGLSVAVVDAVEAGKAEGLSAQKIQDTIVGWCPGREKTVLPYISKALVAAGMRRRAEGGGRKIPANKQEQIEAILRFCESIEIPADKMSSVLLSASRKAKRNA